jgi:4-methylaminobutanoate oxidase (formaldehyde-forming)
MMEVVSDYGIDWEYITSNKATQMAPWLNASGAERIFFIPGEAISDAYLLGKAFADAARIIGVRFRKNTEVTELLKSNQVVTGVRTKAGVHEADSIILAAGVWSTYLAYGIGVALPMAPVRSQYWITEPSESLFPPSSPTVIIPEANFYSRPQGRSLIFGLREANSVYCDLRILPKELGSYQFSSDNGWQDLIENFDKVVPFFPQFGNTGIKNYVAGFSAYTPDNMFVAGEVPGTEGLYIATGCGGAGISVAGGIGLGIAHLAAGKVNPFDFSKYQVNRFGTFDPFNKEHLSKCAKTRSKKIGG